MEKPIPESRNASDEDQRDLGYCLGQASACLELEGK